MKANVKSTNMLSQIDGLIHKYEDVIKEAVEFERTAIIYEVVNRWGACWYVLGWRSLFKPQEEVKRLATELLRNKGHKELARISATLFEDSVLSILLYNLDTLDTFRRRVLAIKGEVILEEHDFDMLEDAMQSLEQMKGVIRYA